MALVKYLAVALLATATLATPALAKKGHVVHHKAMDAYASMAPEAYNPDAAYYPGGGYYADNGYYANRACVRAPDVGAFASDPWRAPPCEPGTGYDTYNTYGW
jgi:hypothetical protein